MAKSLPATSIDCAFANHVGLLPNRSGLYTTHPKAKARRFLWCTFWG